MSRTRGGIGGPQRSGALLLFIFVNFRCNKGVDYVLGQGRERGQGLCGIEFVTVADGDKSAGRCFGFTRIWSLAR